MKSFHIITFGCQMNEHDSERMTGILEAQGCLSTDVENADMVILNTCSIREKAEQKFYSELGRLKQLRLHDRVLKSQSPGVLRSRKARISFPVLPMWTWCTARLT